MWGGRFSVKPAALMQAINVSIGFDKRLAAQDLAGSRAHAQMLADAGVTAVVHPGGSIKDDEIFAAAQEAGLAMVVTGERHFRH